MSDDLVSRLRRQARNRAERFSGGHEVTVEWQAAALLESQAKALSEAKDRHQRLFDTYQAALETSATSPPTSEGIAAAINETNYKYFGDYELSQSQWGAVHCLVNAAHHYLAAKAEIERMTEQALVKDHAIIEAAKLAKRLMTRALAAEERAEQAESALAEAGWHTFADQPESGRKFIALYNDGSGASMFFAFDGGVIDSDGDELYDWFSSDHSYDRWAYLPDDLEFWCEVRAEDPVTFAAARAFVQQHEGKK